MATWPRHTSLIPCARPLVRWASSIAPTHRRAATPTLRIVLCLDHADRACLPARKPTLRRARDQHLLISIFSKAHLSSPRSARLAVCPEVAGSVALGCSSTGSRPHLQLTHTTHKQARERIDQKPE